MKAYAKNAVLFLMLLCSSFILASCGSDDDDEPEKIDELTIVGTWIEEDSEPYVLTFNANGTGSITYTYESRASITLSQQFSYSTSISSNGITFFTLVHNSGDPLLNNGRWNYDLVENGKRLVINDGEMIFKRR